MSSSEKTTAVNSSDKTSLLLEDKLQKEALASEEEEERLEEVAEILSRESKRLRDEADRVESQAKRMRGYAQDAYKKRETLLFESQCLALHRNDANTTRINTFVFPVGYAQPLGKALQHNTHVTSLHFCLGNIIPPTISQQSDTSKRKKHIAPLCKFVKTSKVLKEVLVATLPSDPFVGDHLAALLVGACFQNGNIEDLAVRLGRLPAEVFSSCKPSTALKTLCIEFGPYRYEEYERQRIALAFRLFSCLTTLDLQSSDPALMEAILENAQNGNCPLQVLILSYRGHANTSRLFDALSALLHAPNQSVRRLQLEYVSLNARNMARLISALKRSSTTTESLTSATTVSELSFRNCSMDVVANDLLMQFMETKIKPEQTTSSLQELEFHGGDVDNVLDRLNGFLRRGFVYHDGETPFRLYSTIGSQIQSLSLQPFTNKCPKRLSYLCSASQDRVGLQTLSVKDVDAKGVEMLARCIDKIQSLRSITANFVNVSARPILDRLRANGRITKATIHGHVQTSATARLARAYADRNRLLPPLLIEMSSAEKPSAAISCSDSSQQKAMARSSDAVEESSTTNHPKKALCVALLDTTMQIPATTHSSVLGTLLRLKDSVGYL